MARRMRDEKDLAMLRHEVLELFTPSAPVAARQLFAGRASQICQPVDVVAERGRHGVIYGERRGGIFTRQGGARIFRYRFENAAMQPYIIMEGISGKLLDGKAMGAFFRSEQRDFFSSEPGAL